MRTGLLRHRITFMEPNRVQNEIGEWTEEWRPIEKNPTVWASIEPLRGRTYFEAKQSTSEVDGKITIRHKQIEPFWHIIWRDWEGIEREFKIISIIYPHQRGKAVEILYKEDLD